MRTCLPLPASIETVSTLSTEKSKSESCSSATQLLDLAASPWKPRQSDCFYYTWDTLGQRRDIPVSCGAVDFHNTCNFFLGADLSDSPLESLVFPFDFNVAGFTGFGFRALPLCLKWLISFTMDFLSAVSNDCNCCLVISLDWLMSIAFVNDNPFCLSNLPFKSLSRKPITSLSRISSSVNTPKSHEEASFRRRLT